MCDCYTCVLQLLAIKLYFKDPLYPLITAHMCSQVDLYACVNKHQHAVYLFV